MKFKVWSPFVEEINHPTKAVYAELTSASDEFEQALNLSNTDIVRVVADDIDTTVPASWIGIVNG